MFLWDELRLPLFRARTLRDLADLHSQRGEVDIARAMREEALDLFHHYGSREYGEIRGCSDQPRWAART